MAQDDRGADRPAEQSRPAADAGPEQVAATVAELYDSLRALAAGYLRRERPDHTLQPTALVHEAYMKLSQQDGLRWNDRLHFFHIASAQIRRILVDHARTRGRHKRGGQFVRVTFDENLAGDDGEFDLTMCVAVMHHIAEPEAVHKSLGEMVRVTRPGGLVLVWDHNPRNPYWKHLMARVPQDDGTERLIPEAEILKGLTDGGAVIKSSLPSGFVPDFVPPRVLSFAAGAERVVEKTPGLRRLCAHNVVVAHRP